MDIMCWVLLQVPLTQYAKTPIAINLRRSCSSHKYAAPRTILFVYIGLPRINWDKYILYIHTTNGFLVVDANHGNLCLYYILCELGVVVDPRCLLSTGALLQTMNENRRTQLPASFRSCDQHSQQDFGGREQTTVVATAICVLYSRRF